MKSGLSYDMLQGVLSAGAEETIRNSKGGVRKNGRKLQLYFSYQRLDPTAPSGKRQVRLCRQTDVPASTKLSDRRKRELLNGFRSDILEDLATLRGAQGDPSATAGSVMDSYIQMKLDMGNATGQVGHGKGIRSTTASALRYAAKRWEKYPLYTMPLSDVTPAMVNDAVRLMCAEYGGESIVKSVSVLRQAATWALGKRADNPCDGVVTPRTDHKPGKEYGTETADSEPVPAGRINVLTAEQVPVVLGKCAEMDGVRETTGVGAVLALTCGLRLGECCGLRWSDLHLDASTPYLSVRRSVNRAVSSETGRRDFFIGPCKSVTSVRNVPIPAATVAFLKSYRARTLERLMGLEVPDGEAKPSIGELYLLGDLNGGFRVTDSLSSSWSHYAHKYHVEGACGPLTFHNLRDTYASRLYDDGMSDLRVSKLLGHSSTAITHARYIGGTDGDAFAGLMEHQGVFDFGAGTNAPEPEGDTAAEVLTLAPTGTTN